MRRTVLALYMPVLHEGYRKLIERVAPDAIYLVGDDLFEDVPEELDYIRRKDSIRAVPTVTMQNVLAALQAAPVVVRADESTLLALAHHLDDMRVVMPNEDVSRFIAEKYLKGAVAFEDIFLRWDRTAVSARDTTNAIADRTISHEVFDRLFMRAAEEEAERSSDWWRRVGAVLVQNDEVILSAHNVHVPHPDAPNAFGDPRSLFKRGIRIESSTAEHAEATIIAEAAKRGISTQGSSLYVTTFPCPACAKLIAHAGIERLYFTEGYAILDGENILREKDVELIHVDMGA